MSYQVVTALDCDYCCKASFEEHCHLSREAITELAMEAKWAVWPNQTAMCPDCTKILDTTDCGDAWDQHKWLTTGRIARTL